MEGEDLNKQGGSVGRGGGSFAAAISSPDVSGGNRIQ